MSITQEERIKWLNLLADYSIRTEVEHALFRAINALEAAERKNTMPCPHCDFASGQRGMDRCSRCDGTGRVSVVPELIADRDEWKDRAETAERERDALAKVAAKVQCWNCPLGKKRQCVKLPEPDCSVVLLEWARQQARGEAK